MPNRDTVAPVWEHSRSNKTKGLGDNISKIATMVVIFQGCEQGFIKKEEINKKRKAPYPYQKIRFGHIGSNLTLFILAFISKKEKTL